MSASTVLAYCYKKPSGKIFHGGFAVPNLALKESSEEYGYYPASVLNKILGDQVRVGTLIPYRNLLLMFIVGSWSYQGQDYGFILDAEYSSTDKILDRVKGGSIPKSIYP